MLMRLNSKIKKINKDNKGSALIVCIIVLYMFYTIKCIVIIYIYYSVVEFKFY